MLTTTTTMTTFATTTMGRRGRHHHRARRATMGVLASTSAADAFVGSWVRDATQNQHVTLYLIAHGVGRGAMDKANMEYRQTWTRAPSGVEGEFTVHTTSGSGTNRVLTYPLGEFIEKYESSTIFGDGPGEVKRCATFDPATRTHFVSTVSSLGDETTTRVVDEDGKTMRCRREFKRRDDPEVDVWCAEVFIKQ